MSGAAPNTLRTYRTAMRSFDRWLAGRDPGELSRVDIRGYLAAMRVEGNSPSTIRHRLVILRALYRWAISDGLLVDDPTAGVTGPPATQQVTPVLDEPSVRRLLATTKGTDFRSRRDQAIILLMLDTGIRAAECVGLRLDDVDLTQRAVVVRGKAARRAGPRTRVVPVGIHTALAIDRWLRVRGDARTQRRTVLLR